MNPSPDPQASLPETEEGASAVVELRLCELETALGWERAGAIEARALQAMAGAYDRAQAIEVEHRAIRGALTGLRDAIKAVVDARATARGKGGAA
jgi:hypothetical protein